MTNHFHITGILYNVLIKPRITQTQGETEEAFQVRYAEACAKTKTGKSSVKRKIQESDDEFEERLRVALGTPDAFYRQEILIDERQRDEMRIELWNTVQQFLVARRNDYWLRNRANCYTYNSECQYWSVCNAAPDVMEGLITNYMEEKPAHEELADYLDRVQGTYRDIMTHSRRTMFLACQRKQWFRYVRQIVPEQTSAHLSLGSTIHECLELWYRGTGLETILSHIDAKYSDRSKESIKREWQYARAMMSAYAAQYPEEQFVPVGIEIPWHGQIVNPRTESPSKAVLMVGKADGLLQRISDGTYWLLEHKTASRVDHGYITRLQEDPQIILYSHYLEMKGLEAIEAEEERNRHRMEEGREADLSISQMYSSSPF